LILCYTTRLWDEQGTAEGAALARSLCDDAKQFCLQDELSFLILLAGLVRSVIFPADRFLALAARDISDDMLAGRHRSLVGFSSDIVHNVVEQVSFAMLSAKVLVCSASATTKTSSHVWPSQTYPTDDIVMVGKVNLAALAPIDLLATQVNIVSQAHGDEPAARSGPNSGCCNLAESCTRFLVRTIGVS
jgi:hypothetical protein